MSTRDDPVQERITGFWSKIAPDYEAHAGNVPARDGAEYRAWAEAIRDLLPEPPADVLDIATGTGFVALIAASLGHRVTGIDLSSEMLAEARAAAERRGLEVTFARADAVEPDLPPGSFDAIVSRHFIWTLREPRVALQSWLRLLRPGGLAIAIDGFWFGSGEEDDETTAEGPELFKQHYTPEIQAALPAIHLTSVTPIVAMFEAVGFEDVSVGDLTAVHALADAPPSSEPWYVIVAHRPS